MAITANQCLENAAAELEGVDHARQEEKQIGMRIKVAGAWQALAKTINQEGHID